MQITNAQQNFGNSGYSEATAKETKAAEKKNSPTELSDDDRRIVNELQSVDTKVRAHEAAHQAAGGGMTGGASFTYEQGPDGKMYAVAGEVPISIPSGSTPQENIKNARQAIAAATAPADPSGQDMAVASSAAMMLAKAQQQLTKEVQEKVNGTALYKQSTGTPDAKDTNNSESIDISV